MKALSLIQPWATGIMIGNKKIETRSWKTDFRGWIAIHASKGFPRWAREFAEMERSIGRIPDSLFPYLPFGAIIGFAKIGDMQRTEVLRQQITAVERLYGDYSDGRWGWLLTDVVPLNEPIPCKGALGLWEVPHEINTVGAIAIAWSRGETCVPLTVVSSIPDLPLFEREGP